MESDSLRNIAVVLSSWVSGWKSPYMLEWLSLRAPLFWSSIWYEEEAPNMWISSETLLIIIMQPLFWAMDLFSISWMEAPISWSPAGRTMNSFFVARA